MKLLFVLMSILIGGNAFAEGKCYLNLKTASGKYFEKTYKADLNSNTFISVETITLKNGEKLSLNVSRVANGYVAVLATPHPEVYPPVPPTFSLRGISPSPVEGGRSHVVFLNYERPTDPDIVSVDLRCFLQM